MEHCQGHQAGSHIIKHDAQSAMNMAIKPADWERLEDVEKTEQGKTGSSSQRMERGQKQGDELADNFINYDNAGIGLVKNLFRRARGNSADDKERGQHC